MFRCMEIISLFFCFLSFFVFFCVLTIKSRPMDVIAIISVSLPFDLWEFKWQMTFSALVACQFSILSKRVNVNTFFVVVMHKMSMFLYYVRYDVFLYVLFPSFNILWWISCAIFKSQTLNTIFTQTYRDRERAECKSENPTNLITNAKKNR